MSRFRVEAESGAAMLVVLLVVVGCGMLIAVTIAVATGTRTTSHRHADRLSGLGPAESAVAVYRSGLRRELYGESEGYVPTAEQLRGLLAPGMDLLSNAEVSRLFDDERLAVLDADMVGKRLDVTVREPRGDGSFAYWQLYRIVPPDLSLLRDKPNLVLYVRAWVASPAGKLASRPRLIRVELRPGLFADYQILANGPIQLMDGATLNGPIHSNGFDDDRFDLYGDLRVWAAGSVSCSDLASISTAFGTIRVPCGRQRPNSGMHVDFARVHDSFGRIREACADGRALCLGQRAGDDPFQLELRGTTLVADGASYDIAGMGAVLVQGEAELSGHVGRRFTVAAQAPPPGSGGASIRIVGNIGVVPGADRATLGVIAQGDVVVGRVEQQCGVTAIRAALVAGSGGVTIDPRWTTPIVQEGAPFCNGAISLVGSLAGHHAPTLHWEWAGSDTRAGYAEREYRWDPQLARTPPPFLPHSFTWQVLDWRDANLDCLGHRREDLECR